MKFWSLLVCHESFDQFVQLDSEFVNCNQRPEPKDNGTRPLVPKMKLFFCIVLSLWLTCIARAFSPAFRGDSRFFLDTANEEEWDELLCTGLFHGVTTNPTLLERAKQPCTVENLHRMARKALVSVDEFMAQTWGNTVEEMYDVGMALSEPARDRIVVKVPVTFDGVQVATKLIQSGCRVCLTAGYNAKQALIAVSIGAEYLAPYLGRMDDAGKQGTRECIKMRETVEGMQGETRILVASIRNVKILSELAENGMETMTFSPDVARQLFVEPLTDKATAGFEKAVEAANQLYDN